MPRQRAIRFPDDLHDAIEAEARRLGHPWTFSSVVINDMRGTMKLGTRVLPHSMPDEVGSSSRVQRGSPSPSLERARKQMANKSIT